MNGLGKHIAFDAMHVSVGFCFVIHLTENSSFIGHQERKKRRQRSKSSSKSPTKGLTFVS